MRTRKCSRAVGLLAAMLLVAGCAPVDLPRGPATPQFTIVLAADPVVEHRYLLPAEGDVVGELQVIQARDADTFVDIARAYGLGYDELVEANPDVDPWLPGEGTRILLPTRFVLPDAPRSGIVLNLATRRLFWYPEPAVGEPAVVHTFPIGIGREGWETPLGTTRVIARHQDPTWVVPESIRRERAAQGDPLPARVPPGPDNPLGRHALRLALPSYLIHGTNRPAGIGMRVSHGCIQMFPEDIEFLHGVVPLNTAVHIVDQPLLDTPPWSAGALAQARPVRNIVTHPGDAPAGVPAADNR